MVLSDALVEETFQTLVQMQALLLLQHKSLANVIAKIQAEAIAQQPRQLSKDADSAATSGTEAPSRTEQSRQKRT